MSWSLLVQILSTISRALPLTIFIMATSLAFGLILGAVFAAVKVLGLRFQWLVDGLVSFLRGTPTIVQLFLVYYGLPKVAEAFGVDINDWDKMVFTIVTFSLNAAAYLSEVLRAGYLAVERGQWEAGRSVGLSDWETFHRIAGPQALLVALPNLQNCTVELLKETSLAFTIGVIDIMGMARIVAAKSLGLYQFESFFIVALVYWLVCTGIDQLAAALERRLARGRRTVGIQAVPGVPEAVRDL